MPGTGGIGEAVAELVDDPARLRELEPSWRELAISRSNAFVTPEWFWAWYRHYGADHELAVGVIRHPDGRLRGLLPMVSGGSTRFPTTRFAGSGLGDHFHPVAAEGDESMVAGAMGRALTALPRPKPALVLENVDAGAAWWPELSRSTRYGSGPLVYRRTALPYIRLDGRTWDEYLASRSRNLRSQLRRKRRALEDDHGARFRWTQPSDDVAGDVAALFRLHDLRWADRPGTSSLTSQRARAFHADFARAAAERGWLRLGFLEVDGAPVAAWYGWRLGVRFAYYQAGFDPAWAARSVGLVMFAETIRKAASEGAREYDMLLGVEQFKLRFANAQRPACTALIAPRLRFARLAVTAEIGARRLSRRVPFRVRAVVSPRARGLLRRLPHSRRL